MGKLHETLAVEKDAKNVANKIIAETSKEFSGRNERFNESHRKYEPLNAEDMDLPDEEHIPMVTTVKKKLDYTETSISRLLDILYQKEVGNASAKGDIEIGDDIILANNVPVALLVQYENILSNLRNLIYNNIPTLDPSKVWKKDTTENDIYIADIEKRIRTKKVPKSIILAPESKDGKHKAQAQLINVDEKVGDYVTTHKSGAFSPKEKSDLLNRVDEIINAIKVARAKANSCEAGSEKIGRTIFKYINGTN